MEPSTPPLRIAFLAHGLRVAGGLSVGRNLIDALIHLNSHHTFLFVVPAECGYDNYDQHSEQNTFFPTQRRSILSRLIFDEIELPRIIQSWNPHVIVGLGNTGLSRPPCPQAILCQNAYRCYPTSHFPQEDILSRARRAMQTYHLRRQLSHTNLLICQTKAMRDRMVSKFDFQRDTHILPNALSTSVPKASAQPPLHPKLTQNKKKFRLIYVTRYYRHKNLESLITLFAENRSALSDITLTLTIAPHHGSGALRLLRAIEKHGLTDSIIVVGEQPQESLASLYGNCDAIIMPSLLESFSATYLEAMHFGLPILTSDLDFAHSVCADAALYFDPWDTSSILSAILRLKNDPSLARELQARGRRQLATFPHSWAEVAKSLLAKMVEIS